MGQSHGSRICGIVGFAVGDEELLSFPTLVGIIMNTMQFKAELKFEVRIW